MNPNQANKITGKEMAQYLTSILPLLEKHPDNKVLLELVRNIKKWIKRSEDAHAELKKEGYSAEFEELWKLYDYRTGSKSEAYGSYCKIGVEHEVLMNAVRLYKKDISKQDVTQAHLTTWLNQKRWESYEATATVRTAPKCEICKTKDHYSRISLKDKQWVSFLACVDCQKYDRMKISEVKEMIA